MAEVFQFGFGNPDNFSDWAAYAGFDRKTGMPATVSTGVEPPKDMQELFQKGVSDPFSKQVSSVQKMGTNISNAMGQFGQGNMIQGMNAIRGAYPNQQQNAAPSINWKLDHDID